MTDHELKKLRRSELLEMLLATTKENEDLRRQITELNRELDQRNLTLERAGSIAEASLRINRVFDSAQEAAEQYLTSIRNLQQSAAAQAAQTVADAEQKALEIIAEAKGRAGRK